MALVSQICEDLDNMGIKRALYKSDQEYSIRALLDAVKVQWKGELVPEVSPKGDKNSNGAAEVVVKTHEALTRTFKLGLEARIGREIPDDAVIMEWAAEWASAMHRRYRVSEKDGCTSFKRCRGKDADRAIVIWGAGTGAREQERRWGEEKRGDG